MTDIISVLIFTWCTPISITANGTYLTLSFHLSSSVCCIPLEITCIFHHQPKQAQREKNPTADKPRQIVGPVSRSRSPKHHQPVSPSSPAPEPTLARSG